MKYKSVFFLYFMFGVVVAKSRLRRVFPFRNEVTDSLFSLGFMFYSCVLFNYTIPNTK